MSENARPNVKPNQSLLDKVIPQQLEKIITTALSKLKNVWKYENSMSGIQFYGDLED